MFTRSIRAALAICFVATWFCLADGPAAADTTDDVSVALENLSQWLGDGENGQRWRKYLKSESVFEQLEKGSQADPEVVAAALAQYQSGAHGLDMKRFVAVREALANWHKDLDVPSFDELPALLRAAKDQLQPAPAEEINAARERLTEQMEKLDGYLTPGGENGKAWKRYLEWDVLRDQTAADATLNVRELDRAYWKFRANHEGLELDVFQKVADSLEEFYGMAAASASPQFNDYMKGQLEQLAETIGKYAAEPTEEQNSSIGLVMGRLEIAHQAPELVRAVRKNLSHPNLSVQVSERFINAGMSRPVDDSRPVVDNILGTHITGDGRTMGKVTVNLRPSRSNAQLETVLEGSVVTDTVGQNGPVYIYSDGVTKVRAVKRITLDKEGLSSKPAVCRATTDTDIQGIATTRDGRIGEKLIRRAAWRRIDQQQSQAEEIAAEHAAGRVERAVNKEAKERFAKAQGDYDDKFRNPLLRRGQFPQVLRFRTTDDHLFVTGLQANRYQLGAPNAPPSADSNRDILVRVHESMINNLAGGLLAGKTYSDKNVEELGKRLGDEWEEKLKSKEDEDPWSITFAPARPVTIVFSENKFTVTIRGQRYTSGDREYEKMNITAIYTMEKTDTGAKMTRQGEIEIFPPGFDEEHDKLSASQVALRRILARRMQELFPPEIVADAKPLKGEWAKVGALRLETLASGAGWLTLGWNAPEIDRLTSNDSQTASK